MSDINTVKQISDLLNMTELTAEKFYKKSYIAKEFLTDKESGEWFNNRLKSKTVFLTVSDYESACLSALRALKNFAETDFGSSRQRDFNQTWADTTRGYLGEKAFQKFLSKKSGIESKLEHKKGHRNEFIHTDIYKIKKQGEQRFREPNKTIGIKTTKFNGMWLDIPGSQFQHSDCHVLVKLHLEINHIFSFFKGISVFKDKLLSRAVEKGYFNHQEACAFFSEIPDLKQIPAYIAGFVNSKEFRSEKYEYTGKKGHKHYTIESWKGKYERRFLQNIRERECVKEDIKFRGINKFSHDSAYIFNTGSLKWSDSDWQIFFNSL